ncbi:hypothetical protein D3C78_1821640 [compost metagenome]
MRLSLEQIQHRYRIFCILWFAKDTIIKHHNGIRTNDNALIALLQHLMHSLSLAMRQLLCDLCRRPIRRRGLINITHTNFERDIQNANKLLSSW